jgi:TatD DNase family protein
VWAIVGMHPTSATGTIEDGSRIDSIFDVNAFKELARNPKVIAIGECGLEYFHSKPEDIAHQKEVFIQNIEVANAVNKPLMLHVRNARKPKTGNSSLQAPSNIGLNAYLEAIQILKDHAKVPADFHFFAGTIEDMRTALKIGCSISFTGVITFARSYDELIKSAPIEKIMTETDCPFVSPIPHRGKRNEPAFVIEVVKQIAKIRDEDELEVAKQVLENAKKFFRI